MRRTRPLVLFAVAAALALAPDASHAAAADSAKASAPAKPAKKPGSSKPSPAPDVSSYQQLLDDLLTVVSGPGEPVETRFDYEKFYDQRGRFERCVRIQRDLLAVPPSAMGDRTRMAWAINFYNFLVLETATENLLVPDRGRLRYLGPRDIQTPNGPFFTAPLVEIEGRKYSLDTFEHHFLFADFDRARGGPPPAALDPRVHFAIVCGAIGCPALQPRAYRADSLDLQLDAAIRNALASPRHLMFLEESGRVQASAIFQWYVADFGGWDGAFKFLMKYAPPKTRAAIQQHKITSITGMTPWDWNLNQAPHKKEI